MMFLRIIFYFVYYIRNYIKIQHRVFIKVYDKILSLFYPYVWRSLDLQYTPQHIFLTGGLIPTRKQEKYFRNAAVLIAMAYDNGVSQVTLHLPYALWGYTNISTLTAHLNQRFKRLGYRPFISFVSREADQLIIDNTDADCEILQGRCATILVLGPTARRSDLSASQLVVQLMDQRHSTEEFIKVFEETENLDMKIFSNLHGLQMDASGVFNKRPELVLIFGGDFNRSVSSLPFWMLREAIIRFCGSLRHFSPSTLSRYLYWFDAYRARKIMEIHGT